MGEYWLSTVACQLKPLQLLGKNKQKVYLETYNFRKMPQCPSYSISYIHQNHLFLI